MSIACEVADGGVDAAAVGLVHDEHVADLEQAGLARLDRVTPSRRDDDDRRVGGAGDRDLHLTDADGLDEHPRVAGGVEHAHRVRRRTRESTELAARRHRAHEHAVVGVVLLHADTVAEDRAAGERARRDRSASTATRSPARRSRATRPSVSVDFPAPGAPVMPTTAAFPAPRAGSAASASRAASPPDSTIVRSRASAARSPWPVASTSAATGWVTLRGSRRRRR